MKSVEKKRYVSFIIVIFMILGMCFEYPKADSSFEYTNKGKQGLSGISKSVLSDWDICTDDLIRISEKDNEIIQGLIQGIRLKTAHNYKLRHLIMIIESYFHSYAYMTETVMIKLLSGIIFSSITVIMYIHAKDGEKQNNTL